MFKIFSSLQKVLLDIVDLEHQLFEGMDFVLLTALPRSGTSFAAMEEEHPEAVQPP